MARVVLLCAALAAAGCGRSPKATADAYIVQRGPFVLWSAYRGRLGARHVEPIASRHGGSATLAELAPEGATVHAGDVLVRFDDAEARREGLKLERDVALASAELDGLTNAALPLALGELDLKVLDAEAAFDAERRFLSDSEELAAEDLVSEQELAQQRAKVERLRAGLDNLRRQRDLTVRFLHPAQVARASATLAAAERSLALAREDLSNAVVRAPTDGLVVYCPLHIGTDYRTVRVGDTVYRNQPFLLLANMSDLVVECRVPEAELPLVAVGSRAVATPVAYPDLAIEGRVESIGAMAETTPGREGPARFFRVVLALSASDPRLRPGMTADVRVLSREESAAVCLPRSLVSWDGASPYVRVRGPGGPERRDLRVGEGNATVFRVIEGLVPGDVVLP